MPPDPIRAMDIWRVAWPLKMARRHGVGDIADTVPGVIIRLTTASGLEGWGEAAPWSVFTGTVEAAFHALDRHLRPLVTGAIPQDSPSISAAADRQLVGNTEAKAALSMALEDLRGRQAGLSCAQLWGGVIRDRVPLSVSIANPDFAADMEFMRDRLREGVRIFKVKTGFLSGEADLERLAAVAESLPPDGRLRIDYNQGLPAWNALGTLREVERFRPEFIEQPVPRARRDVMAELVGALQTPVLADESVFSPEEAIEMVRHRFARAVSIKLMKSGSVDKARAIAAIAEAAGIPAYGGTMYEGGIALAAALHFACSTPNLKLGAELYTAQFVFGADVLKTPLDIRGGATHLHAGTGLGVDIDIEALKEITVESRSG